MLFALVGFYKADAESHLLEIAGDINEYLGQVLVPPRLAAVLRSGDGARIGNIVVIDAPAFGEAEARLRESPALQAGLYDRCEIVELQVEIGEVAAN
jgi:hypothetical protein